MALIQCPECGNRVSELALQCPHCGFSIADTFREYICPDCGRIVKGKLNSCPDCDCPFDFFKTKGMDNLNHKQITNESSSLLSHNILSQEYHYRQDNPNSSINSKAKVYCICEEYEYIQKFLVKNHHVKIGCKGRNFLRYL